jgi:hypothetical protein
MMFRQLISMATLAAPLVLPGQALAAASAETGMQVAERRCSSCHATSPEQGEASADVPSFMSIAERSQNDLEWLEAFLADPHPPMPDMSLTRQEIQDLIAHFDTFGGLTPLTATTHTPPRGRMRPAHDAETVAEILYNLSNARFLEFAADPAITSEAAEALTRRDLTLVVEMLRVGA